MKKIWSVIFSFVLAFAISHADAGTLVLGELSDKIPLGYSPNTFADISTFTLSNERECQNCANVSFIKNRGKILFRFWSAETLGRSDYDDVHYMVVSTRDSFKLAPEIFVLADNGRKWNVDRWVGNKKPLAVGVSRNNELLVVTASAISRINLTTQAETETNTPTTFLTAHIGTDGNRRFAIIGIDDKQAIWMGNGNQWTGSPPGIVGEYGDRENVLSVYPNGEHELIGAAYININAFNKGIMLLYGQPGSPAKHAWAINSDENNYGFFPAVQWKNKSITVVGKNSSEDKLFSITISEDAARTIAYQIPSHATDNQEAEVLSAMAGVGIAHLNWKVQSELKNLSSVEYKIASSLFKGANIEGRYRNRNFAMSFLRNQTEEMALQSGGTLEKDASSLLFGYIDFDLLIRRSHSMRLTVENANLKGVATYHDINKNFQATSFNNQYSRFALYDIGEHGGYYKGEYSQSKLPIAIAFTNEQGTSVSFFVPDAQFQEISFGIGFDKLAYSKRYESNYSGMYWSGAASFGLGKISISDSIKQKAQAAIAYNHQDWPFVGLHLNGEIGYMSQQRFKSLRGFGHSLSLGLRLQGDMIDSRTNQDQNGKSKAGLAYTRNDYLYGPFVRYNLMF